MLPQHRGDLEPHEDRHTVPEGHAGQATAVTEGSGLRGEAGPAAPLQALLRGPGGAPVSP